MEKLKVFDKNRNLLGVVVKRVGYRCVADDLSVRGLGNAI